MNQVESTWIASKQQGRGGGESWTRTSWGPFVQNILLHHLLSPSRLVTECNYLYLFGRLKDLKTELVQAEVFMTRETGRYECQNCIVLRHSIQLVFDACQTVQRGKEIKSKKACSWSIFISDHSSLVFVNLSCFHWGGYEYNPLFGEGNYGPGSQWKDLRSSKKIQTDWTVLQRTLQTAFDALNVERQWPQMTSVRAQDFSIFL